MQLKKLPRFSGAISALQYAFLPKLYQFLFDLFLNPFRSQWGFYLENYHIRISFRETLMHKIPALIKLHYNIVLHRGFAESSGKQMKFMSENPAETN